MSTLTTDQPATLAPISERYAHLRSIGLIAGEGALPVHVAETLKAIGKPVTAFPIFQDNLAALKRNCINVFPITPGMLEENLRLLQEAQVEALVFAGKVNKWMLFKNPRLDKRALQALAEMSRINDDGLMLKIVSMIEAEGFTVLPQTDFLPTHFRGAGVLTEEQPNETHWQDITYGFELAKEMGRLDIGQTVVVKNKMAIAIEAIEGTDQCIKRAAKWTQPLHFLKGFTPTGKPTEGVVAKVAKPNQDNRFDVPTVGLRTLKTMRKAGLKVLATEANETLFLEPEAMVAFANQEGMIIVSTTAPSMQTVL